jgi:hypothetical protein
MIKLNSYNLDTLALVLSDYMIEKIPSIPYCKRFNEGEPFYGKPSYYKEPRNKEYQLKQWEIITKQLIQDVNNCLYNSKLPTSTPWILTTNDCESLFKSKESWFKRLRDSIKTPEDIKMFREIDSAINEVLNQYYEITKSKTTKIKDIVIIIACVIAMVLIYKFF